MRDPLVYLLSAAAQCCHCEFTDRTMGQLFHRMYTYVWSEVALGRHSDDFLTKEKSDLNTVFYSQNYYQLQTEYTKT